MIIIIIDILLLYLEDKIVYKYYTIMMVKMDWSLSKPTHSVHLLASQKIWTSLNPPWVGGLNGLAH